MSDPNPCGSELARDSDLSGNKNPGSFRCPGFFQADTYQRLNRSTNEYCVLAVRVSSSLSSAEL